MNQDLVTKIFFKLDQVTKETAEYLEQENLSCSFRDVINVKGKGLMTTYFVDLTPDFNVVQLKPKIRLQFKSIFWWRSIAPFQIQVLETFFSASFFKPFIFFDILN